MSTELRLSQIESELSQIGSELSKLEPSRKDGWDIFTAVVSVLVPLSIAWVGHQYAQAMKDAEIQSQETIAQNSLDITKFNTRIAQANTVHKFLEALLSEEEARRTLAIKAVLIALPIEGPQLVQIVKKTDKNPAVRAEATKALVDRRASLIQNLYSPSGSERIEAYKTLLATWADDQTLAPELISFGRKNQSNNDGIYNTLVLLSHMQPSALKPHISEIKKFSHEVEGIGPKTKERAEKLRSRLP